jgi:hypothetical protein
VDPDANDGPMPDTDRAMRRADSVNHVTSRRGVNFGAGGVLGARHDLASSGVVPVPPAPKTTRSQA